MADPATLPIQMARDIAAASQDSHVSNDFLAYMREGAYDRSDASVRSALLAIQTARALPNDADLSPEYIARLFYRQDDRWQAAFFNAMQDQVLAVHADSGKDGAIGVPAGEPQWYAATQHLTDSGFATLEAMYEHARHHRASPLADAA